MYIVTLEEAKKQLNIEDFTEDDTYITNLIDVAYYAIKNKCNNTTWIDHSGNTSGGTDIPDLSGTTIPISIKHAVLMMVDLLYNQRSPISFAQPSKIHYTVDMLIERYINYE